MSNEEEKMLKKLISQGMFTYEYSYKYLLSYKRLKD